LSGYRYRVRRLRDSLLNELFAILMTHICSTLSRVIWISVDVFGMSTRSTHFVIWSNGHEIPLLQRKDYCNHWV
jgi:hypothetical protein